MWKLEFPDLTNWKVGTGLGHPYHPKPRIFLQCLSLTVSNPLGEMRLDHLPPLLLHLNDCRSLEICFKCAFRELAVMCRRPLGNGTALPRWAQPPRDRKVSITWVGPSDEVVRFGEWARKDMQFWVDTWLYPALNVSPPHLAARLEVTSQE
ncbi:hypothetical protein K466DRAFT_212812 [Polyporus arcularius HHB13444]|uniref:Uncharacterized protein n=1 Tax=Polyporus arcularius HHB13444 TaxID=1314778 RepID=A0A5C3P752_9APHY|nr:hypothetical protein K466DRAFT_212812 [Polyporus arcularius HHB13444]